MRRVLIGAYLFLVTVVAVPPVAFASPHAQQTTNPPKTGTSTLTAEDWYDSSVSLLKKGQQFNRAAIQLRKAIGLQEQSKYHMALGCACADRAVSLAQATYNRRQFAIDQAKFQEWLKAWEAAQKDLNNPDYGKPRPEPPTLLTKDDHLPFLLTREEAASQFKTLSKDALTEWETALSLATTPEKRAEVDYVQAWGRELLRGYGARANWIDLPDPTTSKQLILEATNLAPKNPIYWQSLGDMRMDLNMGISSAKDKPGALIAYRQALKLNKTNANLWYRVYDLCKQDDPEQAKEAIRQAAQMDSDNAYPAYRLAGLLFYDTPYSNYAKEITRVNKENDVLSQERWNMIGKQILNSPDYAKMRQAAEAALASVEQGNHATNYIAPVYAPPFPALLMAAWYFQDGSYLDNTLDIRDWHTISVSAGGYIQVTVQQGDKAAAVQATRILIDMGTKMAGDLYNKALPLSGVELTRLNNSFSTVLSAYGKLIEALKEAGDSTGAAQFDAEYQAIKTKNQEYRQADRKARQNSYGGF